VSVTRRRSVADRVERLLARTLLRLPHAAQLKLSGKPQISIDGVTLHPEMQLALAARKSRKVPPLRDADHLRARQRMLADALRYGGDPLPGDRVRDLAIPSPAGELAARHYTTNEPGGPHPLLVFFHGGGFSLGDLDTHDEACRILCRRAGVHVLSVAYRLAPEAPFPAAVEDGEVAFRWAAEHAAELGADPARVGVGGDSAGGNIAAVVSAATTGKGHCPAFQLLLYPVVDRSRERPSLRHFAEGFLLERADIEFFDGCYLGTRRDLNHDVRVSPLLGTSPPRVPTIVVTAGFDPLRDEGEAYAEWLRQHDVPTTLRRFPGMIHGFINMTYVSEAAHEALTEVAEMLRRVSRS
jgi:acetyl esterase